MRFSIAALLSVAGLAAAQSSSAAAPAAPSASGSASGCGNAIDLIISACLQSTEPLVKACSANNWSCMCTKQTSVVTCYNNCPSDPNAFGAQQQLTSWCNAAKAYPDSSSVAVATRTKTGATSASPAVATQSSTKTTNGVHTGFASASGSATPSSSSAGAASGISPAGGLIAAIFGLALL